MSDDDEGADDDDLVLTVDDFLKQLTAMAPQFGADAQHPTFVFHSIIGIAEKTPATAPYLPTEPIQTMICKGTQTRSPTRLPPTKSESSYGGAALPYLSVHWV